MRLKISLVGIQPKEKGLAFGRIEKMTPVLKVTLQSNQSSLCGLFSTKYRVVKGPDGQVVSIKTTADEKREDSGRSLIKRKKIEQGQERIHGERFEKLARSDLRNFDKSL